MKSVSNDEDLYYNDLNMPIFLYSKNRQILFFSTRIDSIFDTEPIKQNGNTSLIVNRIIHLHLGINYIKSKYITEQTWRILII